MDFKKEKRERFLTNLINEAIINVLAEKASSVPPASTPPAPTMNPTDADVTNPTPSQSSTTEEKPFDVDEMVNRLNVLRGSKSFKDPEVYGRLTTFFKNLPEDQKSILDTILAELGKIVIDASEQQAGLQQPTSSTGSTQPPSGNSGGVSQQPPQNTAPAPVSPA